MQQKLEKKIENKVLQKTDKAVDKALDAPFNMPTQSASKNTVKDLPAEYNFSWKYKICVLEISTYKAEGVFISEYLANV